MRLTLRTRILLLIAGTVMGLAVIILGLLSVLARREIDRSVRMDVQATGRILEHLLRERSATLEDKSGLLARQPALMMRLLGRDETIKPDFATVTDSLREWLGQMHADVAVLTDQDGRVLADTEASSPPAGKSQEPGTTEALQGNVWSGVISRKGHLFLAVSVPIREPVSHFVLAAFTTYRAVDAAVANQLKEELSIDIAFVERGRPTVSSLPLQTQIPTPTDTPRLITVNNTEYLALYAPMPNTDARQNIGFVTLCPYRQAMRIRDRLQIAFIGTSVLTLFLALTAGKTLARSITRPLDGLIGAAQTLREGEWPAPLRVQRNDEIGLLQTVFNEMTESMKASQERLLSLIDIDLLTGLENHRRFQERLEQETTRCVASGQSMSLLLIDLDHFNEYNQKHGHAAGDSVLSQFALLLRNSLPESAFCARYGGEEFTVLLPKHDITQAEKLAERIQTLVRTSALTEGEEQQKLTVSVGCAEFGTNTTHSEGMMLAAELAVSRAKQLGRDRICRFDSVPGAMEQADPYQLHQFIKDGSLATIQALAAAVDAKDPYTQGHSRRVAEYASALGRYIGLPEKEVELIYTTGTLHDVGKIGVPDAILKKPARLDEEERVVMETHPVLGEVIVRKVPQLAATLPGVRNHHERWDGKGYPDGFQGEATPFLGRILAVADTYDAMTSDRPYRKGLAIEIALAEITKGAGTQFDPVLAKAFVAMMEAQYQLKKAA